MESQFHPEDDSPPGSTHGQGSLDSLTQLQTLANLYHSRGRLKEAQEIYKVILEIRAKKLANQRDIS